MACGDTADSGTKPKTKPGAAANVEPATPSLAEQAAAFVAAPASESHAEVNWEVAAQAMALAALRSAESMDQGELLAIAGGHDPIAGMLTTLAEVNFAEQGGKQQVEFIATWMGDTDCKATPKTEAPTVVPSPALAKRLPPPLQTAAKALATGHLFDVECKDSKTVVMLDDEGTVIALERPRSKSADLDLSEVLEDNRFVGYMDAPQ